MMDWITRLTARSLQLTTTVQPLLAPLFAPTPTVAEQTLLSDLPSVEAANSRDGGSSPVDRLPPEPAIAPPMAPVQREPAIAPLVSPPPALPPLTHLPRLTTLTREATVPAREQPGAQEPTEPPASPAPPMVNPSLETGAIAPPSLNVPDSRPSLQPDLDMGAATAAEATVPTPTEPVLPRAESFQVTGPVVVSGLAPAMEQAAAPEEGRQGTPPDPSPLPTALRAPEPAQSSTLQGDVVLGRAPLFTPSEATLRPRGARSTPNPPAQPPSGVVPSSEIPSLLPQTMPSIRSDRATELSPRPLPSSTGDRLRGGEATAALPPPVIRVTIGRIEVRSAPAPVSAPARVQSLRPKISLDEYLQSRNGGDR